MKNDLTVQKTPIVTCLMISICFLLTFGCGTTKWSDTSRTGTEQLLISNAIDRVVNGIDFSPMQDKKCFLNTSAIESTTDHKYLAMTIRQYLSAAGAILATDEAGADYIVEVRAGAVGTDRDDLLVGVPATTLPSLPNADFTTTTIPEIPIIKRTKQRGVAKIALFAYNKVTGMPYWASGNSQAESTARNLWFVGAGPLTRGTIYHETTFAGNTLPMQKQSSEMIVLEQPQVFSKSAEPPPMTIPLAPPVNPPTMPKY